MSGRFTISKKWLCCLFAGLLAVQLFSVQAETPARDGWTLKMHSVSERQDPQCHMVSVTRAEVTIPYQRKDGPVKAQGPLTIEITCGSVHRTNLSADMLLEGTIKGDLLTFRSTLIHKHTQFIHPRGEDSVSGPLDGKFQSDVIKIRLRNGEKVSRTLPAALSPESPAHETWTVTGSKEERWRVTVNGWDTLYAGDDVLAGGLRVRRVTIIELLIKDGKYSVDISELL